MTTVLIPTHNTSLEDPEIYNRLFSSMAGDFTGHLQRFISDDASEPNSDYIQDPRHEIQAQTPHHAWNPNPLSSRPPRDMQRALDSDAGFHTNPPPPLGIINPAASSNPIFTPMKSATRHDPTATISPSQTHFDSNISPSDISESEQSRRDSVYSREEDSRWKKSQPTKGRKRITEHVEPGSARAIYLEKNRQAASKCRKKQKAEQVELAEKARQCEADNRILRAEKQMLHNEVQQLKELLGQHAGCPDQRIGRWLQMEADRLASSIRYEP